MTNHAHADMDDMGEWAESHPMTRRAHRAHRALPLEADWPVRRAFIPQGCDQQGRVVPTIKPAEPFPVVVDRAVEDYDKPEPLTLKESVSFWAVASAPAIVVVGVVGAYLLARFGHVW